MIQVSEPLLSRSNGVRFSHLALPQANHLREYVPNPMRLFSATLQFRQRNGVAHPLRLDKPVQVEWIRHKRCHRTNFYRPSKEFERAIPTWPKTLPRTGLTATPPVRPLFCHGLHISKHLTNQFFEQPKTPTVSPIGPLESKSTRLPSAETRNQITGTLGTSSNTGGTEPTNHRMTNAEPSRPVRSPRISVPPRQAHPIPLHFSLAESRIHPSTGPAPFHQASSSTNPPSRNATTMLRQ